MRGGNQQQTGDWQGDACALRRWVLKFIFWGRILLWALGLDPPMLEKPLTGFRELLELAEKHELGLLRESWVIPKGEQEPTLALNLA